MLKAEDNEILTRVGPGTLMGELLRRYWTPACLSAEIPEPVSAQTERASRKRPRTASMPSWSSSIAPFFESGPPPPSFSIEERDF